MIAHKEIVLLSILGSPLIAAADTADQPQLAFAPQEQLTVIASRIAMPARQVGASVSVMDARELEMKSYPALSDALRTLPGLQVSHNGSLGSQTSVRIRGEESHRTLMLIDGINVSDPSTTQTAPHFAHMMNSQWGRVEVLRGPQGMIYGADAGGVISVSSKTTDEPFAADLSLEAGEFETQRVNANIRGASEHLDWSLTASDVSSEGFNSRASDPSQDKDGYDNTTFHFNSDLNINDRTGFGLVLRNVAGENEYDNCSFSPVSSNCLGHFDQQSARADWHYQSEAQRHEIAYSRTDTDRLNRVLDTGTDTLESAGELGQWQYLGYSEVGDVLSLVYGLDRKTETYNDELDNEKYQRDQTGAYGEIQSGIGERFFYTAGVRFDDNEDFGEHTSYRLTGAYVLGDVRFKGSYGTGFRAPSLFELAFNNGPAAANYVPQELDEETSKGYELGVEWSSSKDTYVELIWFDTAIEDEIYFDLQAFGGYLQSEGETESQGVELGASAEVIDNLVIGGNVTYNDTALSEDTTLSGAEGGDPRPRRPETFFNLSVRYDFPDERASLALYYRGARDTVDYPFGEGRVALDDYEVLDLYADWRIVDAFEVYVRGENLLDEEYQEINDYNTSGRAAYLGARLTF